MDVYFECDNSNINNDKQLAFVSLLKERTVILQKSQLPAIKEEKAAAILNLKKQYEKMFGKRITEKQLMKKINNMKTDIKTKVDKSKTSNKTIILKEWEKLLLELLNESINRKPSQDQECGTKSPRLQKNQKVDAVSSETEETRNLSITQLQRLVLLEQLKLIRMQQECLKRKCGCQTMENKIEVV